MTVHQFCLLLDHLATDAELEAVRRCVDLEPHPGGREGRSRVLVTRAAPTLLDAILSAIRDLDVLGLPPVGLVNDDPVTLEEIGARIGRSREAVRLWSTGRHAPAGFPAPINPGHSTSRYSWAAVGPWLREFMGLQLPDDEPVLAAVDLALQLRALAARVPRMAAVRDLVPIEGR